MYIVNDVYMYIGTKFCQITYKFGLITSSSDHTKNVHVWEYILSVQYNFFMFGSNVIGFKGPGGSMS